MTTPGPSVPIDPQSAARRLASWGFLAEPDLPDRPGPAYLLIAIREQPTLRHYDPEVVEYWVSKGGRGRPESLTYTTRMPIETDFSWGLIRIVDRLSVSNEYLTFGGHLSAASIDGVTVAVFSSPAPLLRRGGHSQGVDQGALELGAFFGRILLAVDYTPGFEAAAAAADPLARYAAFVADLVARYRASPTLRSVHADAWTLFDAEDRRLQREHPDAWTAGAALRDAATPAV
jgi:hypothetical protein